jgi:hypothetical protein
MYRQIGPGMVQQMQSQCDDCGGSGDFIREKDRCKKCKGKRLLERDHKIEVGIIIQHKWKFSPPVVIGENVTMLILSSVNDCKAIFTNMYSTKCF